MYFIFVMYLFFSERSKLLFLMKYINYIKYTLYIPYVLCVLYNYKNIKLKVLN